MMKSRRTTEFMFLTATIGAIVLLSSSVAEAKKRRSGSHSSGKAKLEIPEQPCAVLTQLYHFFPHSSERDSWSFPASGSIEATARWYMMPPGKEHRLFFDTGEHNYDIGLHSQTIPPGLPEITLPMAIKHYSYRSPDQAHHRARERLGGAARG